MISYANTFTSVTEWLIRAVSAAWRYWRDRCEFARFVFRDPTEAGRIARELGLSTKELIKLSGTGPWWHNLLHRRMQRLGLNFNSVNREVSRDLAICCARCDSKLRCAYDLASSSKSDAWQKYCINRHTFDALKRGPSMHRA
jgi:hypothetical protein